MASPHFIGERLSYDGVPCTVRYIGPVAGTSGSWLGVEWGDKTRGKHDGEHKGVKYFECKKSRRFGEEPSVPNRAGSFIRPTRRDDGKVDFLTALQMRYAPNDAQGHGSEKPIIISGKVAEEVGFDKISCKQRQLDQLQIVILDGMRLTYAYDPDTRKYGDTGDVKSIREVCPRITDLDLSRNLFTGLRPIVDICAELDELKSLRINGNEFINITDEDLEGAEKAFKGIKELALEETFLSWEDICRITSKFADLTTLYASGNELTTLTLIPSASPMTSTLTALHLEFNAFCSLSDISPLSALTSLRNLHLKSNNLQTILSKTLPETTPPPIFSPTIRYLDISSNFISSWTFADSLPICFPGLTSLRFAHNWIYNDHPHTHIPTPSYLDSDGRVVPFKTQKSTDESYMILAARLPCLTSLNFSTITAQDRTNAEMFYLSRIAREMASVDESEESSVTAQHPRYEELCRLYGAPVISRKKEVDARILDGRLITVRFHHFAGPAEYRYGWPKKDKVCKIPRQWTLSRVKGVAGAMFDTNPLDIKLVWETGDYDPVAGFDEEVGDSSEDEDREVEKEKVEISLDVHHTFAVGKHTGFMKVGRWVKREVELKDGPRQFGYCVDGVDVTVRVEVQGQGDGAARGKLVVGGGG